MNKWIHNKPKKFYKKALKLFDIIETVNREKLAKEIHLHFDNKVKTKSFFIQINTGSETQKSGILPVNLDQFLIEIKKYDRNSLAILFVVRKKYINKKIKAGNADNLMPEAAPIKKKDKYFLS